MDQSIDIDKALETAEIEETLFVWMAVHGNLCLALRHPQNAGASREYVEKFVRKLSALLVERGLITQSQIDDATRLERAETLRHRRK